MIVHKGLGFEKGYKQVNLINTKERSQEKLKFNHKITKVWKSSF